MYAPLRMLLTLLLVGLFAGLLVPEPAQAGVTVEGVELVSKKRVGHHGARLYTYRLIINNEGTTLNDVNVYVSCDEPRTKMIDDVAEFGDIAENSSVTSTGTFSVRVKKRKKKHKKKNRKRFDPECLTYEVGFETKLNLSGTVTDMPLPGAIVVGTVTRPRSGRPIIESGRPIIETYTTVADADGNYSLAVDTITEDDFITLEAAGVGDQEGALLTSSVGSVGALQLVGTSGSIIVDSGDFGSLNITHITTAQDELVRRLNNGVLPTTDAELAALRSQVSGAELLTMASIIKTVIDNPGVVNLPPGINNTLELIQDPQVFDDFLVAITSDPVLNDLLIAATQETADQLNIGFSPDDIPGRMYAAIVDGVPLRGGAYVFDFGVNGDGSVTFSNGTADITWLLNADGEIEVTLTDPFLLFESFSSFPECLISNPSGQCRVQTYLEAMRIVRLTNGLVYDQVFVLETRVVTFPDDPLPDVTEEAAPSPDLVYLAFGEEGVIPLTPGDIAGNQIATYYYHQDNNTVGLGFDTGIGADFLNFEPNGTGTAARRGFGFDWSIGTDGTLNLLFNNADTTQYAAFSEDGDITHVIIIGALASSGDPVVYIGEFASSDGSDFSEPNLANRRYRASFAIERPQDGLVVFDYLFLPGGSGCRVSGSDEINTFAQPISWQSTVLDRMDSERRYLFDPTIVQDRRGWQAVNVEPGVLGDRYWLIENADFNFNADPNYVSTDPTVTPGRMNAYEFIEDLTGQFDPCGLSVASTLTTLFSSNNGGVGNMFDVTTGNSAVQVTGIDVNLSFAAGLQADVSVYTVADGYEGTITAPPTCTFDCAFDAGAWTLLSTQTVTSAGQDQPTFVDIDDIVLDANSRTGFWVSLPRDGSASDELRYTNIAAPGFESDGNITIEVGLGVTGQVGAEGIARNRAWNGTVYYNTQ